MKKILITLFLLVSLLFTWNVFASDKEAKYKDEDCRAASEQNLSVFLEKCKPQKVAGTTDYTLETWLKTQVNKWIANVSILLWFIAVAVLVYAAFLFQFAAGEDENITKAKNVIKYTLLWVLLLISSGSIIYVIINTVYFVADK
jgi:hypothetical protein